MEYSYNTCGACAKTITFELNEGKLSNVKFYGGCPGNLQAIPKLVEGMTPAELQDKLEGIDCGGKGTSCADQLVKAVLAASEKEKENASKQ